MAYVYGSAPAGATSKKISDKFNSGLRGQTAAQINAKINTGGSTGTNSSTAPNITPQNFTGGSWLNNINTSNIAQKPVSLQDTYNQVSALNNTQKIENPWQYATSQVMSSGAMDPVMDKINRMNREADPFGSSITNEKIAGEVGAAYADKIGTYAGQISSQQFQSSQNQMNTAASLYSDAQRLAQQGRTDEANLALQRAQMMQNAYQYENTEQYNQWLNNRKLELQQQGMSADQALAQAQMEQNQQRINQNGGGTAFYGSTPWGNAGGGGVGGATGSGSGLNRPQMDWDADGNLVPVGTGGSSGGNGGGYTYSGGYGGSDDYSTYGGGGATAGYSYPQQTYGFGLDFI